MKIPLIRGITPIVGALLFVATLGFAVKNSDVVSVRFYLGYVWQLPLVVIVLIAFAAGALAGVLASLSYVMRQRRTILRLTRDLRQRGVGESESKS